MGRIFDFTGTQTSRFIPNAHVNLKIVGLEGKDNRAGCLMYVIDTVVTAPASQAGKQYTEYCTFGTTPFNPGRSNDPEFIEYAELDDPQAEDPLTARFSNGMKDFKRIFENAGVDFSKQVDMDDILELAGSGQLEFGAHVSLDTDETTGKQRNNINAVYKSGAEEPRLVAEAKKGVTAKAAKTGAAAAHSAKARTREVVEEELD